MGWIYRKKWQRRVAMKKRLLQEAVDMLIAREMRRLGLISEVQINPARDDERLP